MPTLNLGRVRFNWRGEYNPLAAYQEYDTVKADGQSYVCIGDVSGVGPLDPDGELYWDSMLVRGADYNEARDQALQAATGAEESATLAGTHANDSREAATESAGSMEMAERLASEAEGVEVSPGQFSAYHWYKKAEALGSPNEFDLTADETGDTRKARQWMAQVLANQHQGNDNAQAIAQHLLGVDPHSQYEKKIALKAAAYREVVGPNSEPLMAKGAFGVGAKAPIATDYFSSANFNDFNVPDGGYTVAGTWLNGPLGNGNHTGLVEVKGRVFGNHTVQVFRNRSIANSEIYERWGDGANNVWYPWQLVYKQNNIVGTVSQSGGMPTGAVLQRDSNSFGEWTKWADGTMECWSYVLVSFQATNYLQAVWTYPQPFTGSGRVTPEASAVSYLDGAAIAGSDRISAFDPVNYVCRNSTASGATVRFVKQASSPDFVSGQTGTVKLRAVGRWY
ncbi:hypothetical protein LG331_08250 [Vreelandella aquamarina]|uniref:hypothetical protein n=1 Tax=Vreelandella aquamarina TaxID=77097 RepID=UPI00384B38D5